MIRSMTEGRPWKLILQFSLPVMAGNLFYQLYNVMDSVIVGQMLGVNALAAVGGVTWLTFFSFGIVMGMTNGFGILISQSFGENDERAVRHYTVMSFLVSAVLSVLMSVGLCAASGFLLKLLHMPQEIRAEAGAYIRVIYAGIFVSFLYNMLASIARALGDSRTPLYFLILSSVLNVVLDIAMIAVFQMGVEGTAIATVISQAVSAVLCFFYVKKNYSFLQITREDLHFSWDTVKRMMRLGIPMALQYSITSIGNMVVQSFLNQLGAVYIAAYATAGKMNNIVTDVFPAMGVATATFVGQNCGARRYDRVREGVRSAQIMVLGFSVLCGALIYLCGDFGVRIFVREAADDMVAAARQYQRTVLWFFPFLGTIFIYRNALQGLGYGFMPMMGGVFELIARGIAANVLAGPLGYFGICLADPCAWVGALIPLIPVYFYHIRHLERPLEQV